MQIKKENTLHDATCVSFQILTVMRVQAVDFWQRHCIVMKMDSNALRNIMPPSSG
jgi:hypothetical protein